MIRRVIPSNLALSQIEQRKQWWQENPDAIPAPFIDEAPPDYPEGAELELQIVGDLEDELSEEEIEELNGKIEISRRQLAAGQSIPAEKVLAKVRARLK